MLGKLALPAIRELIELGDEKTLREALNRWLPADLAELADALPAPERVQVLRLIQPKRAAETIAYLDLDTQQHLLTTFSSEESKFVLSEMAPDDRTALLAEMPPQEAERFINLLDEEEREVARALLEYREDSVGRLMTPDYLVVHREWTIRHVLDHIRAHGRDRETLNVIYITDQNNKLVDDLRIREILLAPLHAHVSDLTDNQFVSLCVTDGRKKAVEVFGKYDRTALPVVDTEGRMAGIVTLDDVLDVAEQEATRDLQRFGGLEALDDPYMSTALPSMIRKRASWLVILFVGEMLTATAMSFFEAQIARAVVLALFVPLIISSGGNSGSQAATLIIRALALGEVGLKRLVARAAPRTRRRHLARMHPRLPSASSESPPGMHSQTSTALTGCWSASPSASRLIGVVVWGTLTGSMLPFLLRRLGFDPATSSAPFVATLVDVTGLIIYFSIAIILLRGTLL